MDISWKFVMSVITVQFEFYIEKVVREIQFFCDFTSLCVHIVMSQVIKFALIKILNSLATKGAITIK